MSQTNTQAGQSEKSTFSEGSPPQRQGSVITVPIVEISPTSEGAAPREPSCGFRTTLRTGTPLYGTTREALTVATEPLLGRKAATTAGSGARTFSGQATATVTRYESERVSIRPAPEAAAPPTFSARTTAYCAARTVLQAEIRPACVCLLAAKKDSKNQRNYPTTKTILTDKI